MKGKVLEFVETEHIECKKTIFKDDKNLVLQTDGNITNDFCEYKCEIVEKGINMYL